MASGAYSDVPYFLKANKLTEVIFPDERNTYRRSGFTRPIYVLCEGARLFAGFSIG
jgi:hypothetical protein